MEGYSEEIICKEFVPFAEAPSDETLLKQFTYLYTQQQQTKEQEEKSVDS